MSDPVSIRVTVDETLDSKNFFFLERKGPLFLCTALELTPYFFLSPVEINLLITLDEGIRPYNLTYRKKDRPTNVLSFPIKERHEPWERKSQDLFTLGDIIINWQAVEREAQEQHRSIEFHFLHLLVHGFLHLLHYDHHEEDEANEMESLETQVFLRHGLSDPYRLIHPL
jgi:probable rRNA maturation factor